MLEPVRKRRTQAERREEAETRLLQVAIKLMAQRGYDGFTLADVADAAGYSRGLPAHYFGKKEDLLAQVAEYSIGSYNRGVANLAASERGLPWLEALVIRYVEGHGSGVRTLGMLIAEAMVRPKLRKTILRLNSQGLEAIEAEIRAGMELGNIRKDVDPKVQASVIYSFLRGQMSFANLDPSFDQASAGEQFVAMMHARLSPDGD